MTHIFNKTVLFVALTLLVTAFSACASSNAGTSSVNTITPVFTITSTEISWATSTSIPTETPQPTSTETLLPTLTLSPTITPTPVETAELIFFNGVLITIEESQPVAEAIAVRNGLIQAVGSNAEILALEGPDTQMIDLQGGTLMPGFVDGHTHILAFPDRKGITLNEAQDTAIWYGFTTVNEMWSNEGYLNALLEAEQRDDLRLRVNVFPSYNDGILDENRKRILLKTWYPENDPILDPERYLRIPGIKIFVDGDNASYERGCWALSEPYLPGASVLARGVCGTNKGDLYWPQDELNQVVADAQAAGYRVAFHAMGDLALETALNAIEFALNGQPNELYRHQIEHNSLLRPDLLPRYESLDVLTSVRGYGDFCDPQTGMAAFGPDRNAWYANRYALPNLDIHAYVETDFGWTIDPGDRFSQRTLDPLVQIFGIVTHQYVSENGTTCDPVSWTAVHVISVERALQMLTIEPAYAVSMEDYIGSLKPGKYADVIVISGNPLNVEPAALRDLEVWMTMIAGNVEYCDPEHKIYCPEP